MLTKPKLHTLYLTLTLLAIFIMTGCIQKVIAPTTNTTPETQVGINNEPAIERIPPGYEKDAIEIIFKEGVDYCLDQQLFPETIQKSLLPIARPFCDPESRKKLLAIHVQAEDNLGKKIISTYRMLTIQLDPSADPISMINQIKSLPNIQYAGFLQKPAPPPNNP